MRARDAWLRQGALLASACALMLAVGIAASAASPASVTLEVGREVGPGTYRIPFEDADGARRALVFTVPAGLRIKAEHIIISSDCMTGHCAPPGMMFGGEGETGDDGGFRLCLDFETGAECGRGYPIILRAGAPTDDYGDPPGASASRAARAAKYGSMLDRIVASAHIEGAKRGVAQRGGRAVAPRCTEATLGGSRARNAALAVDCDALLEARYTLAGGEGALNWSAGTALAEWDGVTVAGAPPRVVGLDLRARGLNGRIPPQLGSLTALTSLDLSDNALTGSLSLSGGLPEGLRNLPPTLATLRLAGNPFTGCIDERLRLAATNDLATLIKARGLSWCPVRLAPGDGLPFIPGETYQIFRNRIIIDVPATGPRVQLFSLVATESWGSGVAYCFSDVNDLKGVCIDGITGEELSRGIIPQYRRDLYRRGTGSASGSSSTPTPPAGLDDVFDALVESARPAPWRQRDPAP